MEGSIREQGAEGEPREDKVAVSGAEGEVTVSKVDPCGICGKRVMANSLLCVKCVKCRKWIHGRCCDSKSKNWLGEVQGMWGVAELKKVLPEAERNGLSELCKIGDVIWE